jgi:Cd2+/Zn2+-exporting ATPase
MQRHILSSKNKITLISGILIAVGFISKWTTGNMDVLIWSLISASILGAAPIAIQAYQALKVKVVSIDVLVTISSNTAFAKGWSDSRSTLARYPKTSPMLSP